MIDDDDLLVRRACRGDAEAFGALIRRHRTAALRVAAVVLGSAEEADDVTQEAVIRAWRSLAGFRSGAAFRPWFLRIVANTARNQRRSRGRRAALALRAEGRREPAMPGPDELAVSHAERAEVVAALNRLGVDDRLVIGLRYFEQLDEAEMAEVLDCPRGTVKSRLSRALTRLRTELAAEPAK